MNKLIPGKLYCHTDFAIKKLMAPNSIKNKEAIIYFQTNNNKPQILNYNSCFMFINTEKHHAFQRKYIIQHKEYFLYRLMYFNTEEEYDNLYKLVY